MAEFATQSFVFYECPECNHKSQDCTTFARHAVLNHHDKAGKKTIVGLVQLNKYEIAPNFIQLTQNLTSDCLLI